jgi:glycyl-tRNA synthetase beta chain
MPDKSTLLVELLTEELPPHSLAQLGRAFAEGLQDGLVSSHLLQAPTCDSQKVLATPRRLAVLIPQVPAAAADRQSEITGPSVKASAEAVAGFAKKQGIDVKALGQRDTPKGKVFVAKVRVKGAALDAVLAGIVNEAVKKLPIPKVMRWGAGEAQFVRPVHGLVMMHGGRVVPGMVLGIASGAKTRGHRFMGKSETVIASADSYESQLNDDGMVIVDFRKRRESIERQLAGAASRERGSLGEHADLLDEVTALVEHPSVYLGKFDAAYLEVPQECLILTMRQNQKYFPLFDAAGKLLPKFLIVSNMKVADPRPIIGGNERVLRARLSDAKFFFDQDRKERLEERVPRLKHVVYHNKLGSQLERVERLQLLSGKIARVLAADVVLAERAAWLSKADLLTGMVGEFPELQGIMGRYYALNDGEPREVADAIEAHYRPRFAGDRLPQDPVSCAVALADKLDTLAGIFGIGQAPTGEKDPFGLRRHAVGVLRILMERSLPLELPKLIEEAAGAPQPRLLEFLYERLRSLLREQGFAHDEIEAVVSQSPARIDLVPARLEAVREFKKLPESESLAAANKRIGNILKQADGVPEQFDASLLVLPEEKALATTFQSLKAKVEAAYGELQYTRALKALASLKDPVDAFFDKVMVMDKDPRVRANRIGFLGTLHGTMNRIADLSKLAK